MSHIHVCFTLKTEAKRNEALRHLIREML